MRLYPCTASYSNVRRFDLDRRTFSQGTSALCAAESQQPAAFADAAFADAAFAVASI